MHIALLTFDAFNELDSVIAYGMLGRIALLGDAERVSIASPTSRVTSMNGLTLDAHIDLPAACAADAVLIGSGMKTRDVAATPAIMAQLTTRPATSVDRRAMLGHHTTAPIASAPPGFGLYGVALYATATVGGHTWLRAFAFTSWLVSCLMWNFLGEPWLYLLAAAASAIVLIVPSLVMMRREPKTVV